jgi:hypothetical protein
MRDFNKEWIRQQPYSMLTKNLESRLGKLGSRPDVRATRSIAMLLLNEPLHLGDRDGSGETRVVSTHPDTSAYRVRQ